MCPSCHCGVSARGEALGGALAVPGFVPFPPSRCACLKAREAKAQRGATVQLQHRQKQRLKTKHQ